MSSFQRTFLPRVDHHKEETTLVPQNYDAYSVHPTKNGRYIISTGHPQLDRIIGGFELHTLTFWTHRVDQILASGHCVSLIQDMSRYFVAQGIVSDQSTIILTKDVTEGYHFIRNLIPATKSFSTASNQNATKNLNIAWQYEKYFETKTKMTERNEHKFCHSFDLSQIMSPQLVESNCPIIVSVPPTSKSDTLSQLIASDYFNQLFDLLKRQIQQIIDRYTEFRVIRINILQLIPKLHSNLHEIQTELYRFLRKLKLLTHQFPIVCYLPTQLSISSHNFQHTLSHVTDYTFHIQSFTGQKLYLPPELNSFHGIFSIGKISNSHAFAFNSLDTVRFGLLRNSRKLGIEKMHLPPAISRSTPKSNETEINNCDNLF